MKLAIKGKKKVSGTIQISGSKNSAVAIIPAAVLCDETVTLKNIPQISDVTALISILNEQGFTTFFENNTLIIKKERKIKTTFLSDKSENLRGSYYFMGSFLGQAKKIKIKQIGGCNLGSRPIDYHLECFKKLNAKVKITKNETILKTRKLKGSNITLPFPSVGATINAIICATKAFGKTKITNAATEPEVVDVCDFLNSMGAHIIGIGTNEIQVTGVKYLHSTVYTIISDRIEAGTYLTLGALLDNSRITVEGINPLHLVPFIRVLEEMNVNIKINKNSITAFRTEDIKPCHITTSPHPGFPTDLGPIIAVLMLKACNTSTIKETIFENRFSHIAELNKMNANISYEDSTIKVYPSNLKPANLYAYDLRCAAALLLASLSTKGLTTIDNIDVLFRGYEKPLEKLSKLGFHLYII